MEKHHAELKELSELDLEAEIVLVDWEADDPEVSHCPHKLATLFQSTRHGL